MWFNRMNNKQELKIKITGMHCSSCAMNVDFELEDLVGVIESNTSYAKAESKLVIDPELADMEKILSVYKELGYEGKIEQHTK